MTLIYKIHEPLSRESDKMWIVNESASKYLIGPLLICISYINIGFYSPLMLNAFMIQKSNIILYLALRNAF